MTKLLAIDPGLKCGYAIFDTDPDPDDPPYEAAQCIDHQVHWLLDAHKPDVVICERFSLRQVKPADLVPVEVIGVVKDWCYRTETELTMQTASQAKHFWTNPRLKTQGIYLKGKPHANDAMRHLLYYILFTLKREDWLPGKLT